jgi:hypothetical protein
MSAERFLVEFGPKDAISASNRNKQKPGFLQLNATSFSAWQCSQRSRRNPSSSRPHFR